ncbi:MAG: DMT family transporter [Chloroflexi bacterium]|nr:DMT family transporter [Chloroflexota bacterium]
MPVLVIVVLFGLAGGIAVGLQSPLASLISQRVGVMESAFIVHFGGAVAAALVLVTQRGGNLAQWQRAPWYALLAGALGLVVLSAVSFSIPRVGAVPTIVLVVAGQMLISVVIDQFGLFGAEVRPMEVSRLLGIGVLCVGVWLVVR